MRLQTYILHINYKKIFKCDPIASMKTDYVSQMSHTYEISY
jgi:hypothetical protein